MNPYEMLYVCDPTLNEEQQGALSERIQRHIEAGGGKIDSTDDWGIRRLAFTVKRLNEGHYVLLNFTSDPEHVNTLTKQVRLLQGIVRFVVVRKEK